MTAAAAVHDAIVDTSQDRQDRERLAAAAVQAGEAISFDHWNTPRPRGYYVTQCVIVTRTYYLGAIDEAHAIAQLLGHPARGGRQYVEEQYVGRVETHGLPVDPTDTLAQTLRERYGIECPDGIVPSICHIAPCLPTAASNA